MQNQEYRIGGYTHEEFMEMSKVFNFQAFWKKFMGEELTAEEEHDLEIMKEFHRVGWAAVQEYLANDKDKEKHWKQALEEEDDEDEDFEDLILE